MSAGAYARKAAAFVPSPCWVTGGLRFGLDDVPGVDADLMAAWCDTIGDDDMVWILGGAGEAEFYDGLPGRKYLVGGQDDPFSVRALAPDLAPRKLVRGDDASKALGMAAIYPVERQRAELVAAYRAAAGGLAWVWTGWGAAYDPYKSLVKPRVLDSLIVRGRQLTPLGTVDGAPVWIDPADPQFRRLEDV
jgi:hypothetical protein